jgi:hypothetical protein
VQLGDGSTTNRYTPVGVSGLDSAVVMIALGLVGFFVVASAPVHAVGHVKVIIVDTIHCVAESL